MGAAILHHGRVLVARRTHPPELAGGWEFPGGKVEDGENPDAAVIREVREELGCEIKVTGQLSGESTIRPGLVLRVATAALVDGEPIPHEHDAVRWLGPEELGDVEWLNADVPFLTELRQILLDGHRLPGGNVGGAVRIGQTVRRAPGPWTTSVNALLSHVAERGLPCVPRVLGEDECGREILTFLPGRVVDVDKEMLTDGQVVAMVRWTRDFHEAVGDFDDPGPWRFFTVDEPEIVAHNDIAPYNVCFEGDRLVGVFDWDLAGPSTRLMELAFIAWNCVPLTRDVGAKQAAQRLELIASAYGGLTAEQILDALPRRIRLMLDGIPLAAQAGDEGMRNLMSVGEPERSERTLAELMTRIPSIEKCLS